MSWALLFRAREYLKGSVWFYPLIGAVLGPLLAVLTRQADTSVIVPAVLRYAASTASTVLTTIVGAMVGLTGFVVTVTVLAIQMATGTFSGTGDPALMVSSQRDGSIQAINVRGLVGWASRHDQLLVMQAAVGDFVTTGQPVIAVFGNGSIPDKTSRQLRGLIALGVERTIEQDPAFAIRIIVDIAVKALSAAINDPTTAVQAMDHLAAVPELLGSTPLHGPLTFRDPGGAPRLLMPGRTWEDYLSLGVTEIREYGSTSIQVMRRLRAMLEHLRESVRPEYRAAVAAEIAKLDATIVTGFAGSVDKDQARAPDRQGIGGPAASTAGSSAAST